MSTPRAELAGHAFSVSIGIAVQDHAGAGFDRMYREADSALYHAKSAGKRGFALFEPSMSATDSATT